MNEQNMSTEIDYSIGYHHVNCDEYFWPDSEQRIYPCVLFLANTRDEKIYQENVSILSHMYKSLGCACLQIDYTLPSWMSLLPAFESSFHPCDTLGNQLIRIIKDNELDGGPLVIHVIGSDGAMIYSRIAGIMNDYINGAILETLPSPDQAVGAQNMTGSIWKLQDYMREDLTPWIGYWHPENERLRRYLTFLLSSSYIIWHKLYLLFVYRDLQSRLKRMEPEWRELIICEPSNVSLARSILHGRRPSLVPKKLLKFPAKRLRRNSLYQQYPNQYETKLSQFLRNVCDDFVLKTGAITSISCNNLASPSESLITPLECNSLQSDFVQSEMGSVRHTPNQSETTYNRPQ